MTEQTPKESGKNVNRRQALKYMGGGALGLAALMYGLDRKQRLAFLDKDAENSTPPQVNKRKANGLDRPLLGFGCMRLPVVDKDYSRIDTELAEKMIDYAYRRGVNYFDTAYPYHRGQSETFLGNTLKKYPRDSFYLADKMPGWIIKSLDDAKKIFAEQLKKCQVDYFDNYFLHGLSGGSELGTMSTDFSKVYEEMGVLDYLQQEKARGRIRQLGFSFHGDIPFFKQILETHTWDMVMIDLNYLDWSNTGSDDKLKNFPRGNIANKGRYAGDFYKLLEEKGIPCYVMEPVRGGQLAILNPAAVKVLKTADPNRSTASWALRYVATLPNVVTVLSGMSTLEHVVDNINTMTDFKPLITADYQVVDKALEAYLSHETIFCTGCMYCMPCPYGIEIPTVFKVFNECSGDLGLPDPEKPAINYQAQQRALLTRYNNTVEKYAQADHCIGCKKCEKLCPQRLLIAKHMRQIDDLVSKVKRQKGEF